MNKIDYQKLDTTIAYLLKKGSKIYTNKSQVKLFEDIFQELKFLGVVPQDADKKHLVYLYIKNRIPDLIKKEIALVPSK